jgi:hypothetical protein
MDNFDFHKVHKVMKMLNWRWAFSENGVPEEYELRKHAREDLNRVLAAVMSGYDEYQTSCGGFEAYAKRWPAEKEGETPCIQLMLKFVLTDWDEDISYDN